MRTDKDLSEFIVVGVDIMKAFDYVTRGPQDATWVDRVKEVHGDSSAWYLLHFHTHRPVYTHRSDTFQGGLIAGQLCGVRDIPRGTGAPVSTFVDRLETTLGSLKKHCTEKHQHGLESMTLYLKWMNIIEFILYKKVISLTRANFSP